MSAKRKALCIDTKLAVIKALKSGQKKCDVAKRFDLIYSTVNTIWCAREKIEAAAQENSNHQAKKMRKPTHGDLDHVLLKWFNQQRSLNIPVSGPILKIIADQLAAMLGIENYDCSNGWIERFKKRHNINFGRVCSKTRDANRNQNEDFIKKEWGVIRELYQEKDIFSGKETGIFFKMNPNSTLKFRNERCIGGEMSEERLTIFVCANATGTEKRELLVIGKSEKPHCFKNIKMLPVKYTSNRKSWMVTEIFEKEVRSWDEELAKEGRKIILLLDNSTAHLHLQGLKSIRLVFLPVNATSALQPLDQGVIRSLKCCYRKRLVLQAIEKHGEIFNLHKISILDASRILKKAWEDVSPRTIQNSFIRSGFISGQFKEEDLLPLSQWLTLFSLPIDLSDFINFDELLCTAAEQTDQETKTEVILEDTDEKIDKEDENETDDPPPTLDQARHHMRQLTLFYECTGDEEMLNHLGKIESDLDEKLLNSYKQKKITDFLKHE